MSTPSDPLESLPPVPPVVPEEAAAQGQAAEQQAAEAAQLDAIRELATEIAKQAVLDFDPATIRKGNVTGIADTSAPPTLSVQISGDATTTIDGVRYVDSYVPAVGDVALIIKQGTDLIALGRVAAAYSATAWTTVALGAGWSHNGNSNGNVRYRKVWDNGSPKMQWRGAAARSSGTVAVSTPLASGFRPQSLVSVVVARAAAGGSNSVKLDFRTDGTVEMVGGTTSPDAGTTGGTTPNEITHTHGQHSHDIEVSAHTHGSHEHGITATNSGLSSHSHGGAVPNVDHFHPTHNHTGTTNVETPNESTHFHGGSTGPRTPDGSVHTHGSHDHSFDPTVSDPSWVSFNDIEYFID
ncbi:hypothetical protein ACIP79_00370 [Streptomyces sp. NPDC088747]|uniref:hypothetical protein n=1 Tax=Streptomyces sp. NPDC088747 TaxID=3365886 RepID=UPI0038282CF9